MKRYSSLALFLAIFVIISCKEETVPKDPVPEIGWSNDPILQEVRDTGFDSEPLEPYTKDPVFLKDNKLYLDSLKRFFKYSSIDRLDILCRETEKWNADSLKEIVFSNREIKSAFRKEITYLSHYQFLLGKLKKQGENDVLAIIDYTEDWGHQVTLITVDRSHSIIDICPIYASFGDGGEYIITDLNYVSKDNYSFLEKDGYYTLTDPIDTNIYTKTTGTIVVGSNGIVERNILQKDKDIMEFIQTNK